MPRPRILLCSALLSAMFLAAPPASRAAEDDPPADILGLFDQFVSSGAAASRCTDPSDALTLRFLSNFQWVSMYATREISARSPDSTPQQVAEELATRSQAIKAKTHALVKEQGCESEPVRILVRRFILQTAWRPEST